MKPVDDAPRRQQLTKRRVRFDAATQPSRRPCSSVSFLRDSKAITTVLQVLLCLLNARGAVSFVIPVSFGQSARQSSDAFFSMSAAPPSSTRIMSSSVASAVASTTTITLSHTDFGATTANSNPGAPSPVIFLHGLLGSKRNFASIGTSLSKQLAASASSQHRQHRRILGVDLRNHGDNTHQHCNDMTYETMAHDVLAFMTQQSMDRAVLVGHSMGGKVAQACALLQPNRVDGLVVLDIAPVTYTQDDAHWKAVQDVIHTMCQVPVGAAGVTKAQVDQHLRNAIPDPALRAFVLTNMQVAGGTCEWKIPIATIADQLDHLAAFDIPTHHQYHGDVFFIHGGQSRFVKSSYLGRIAEYFPNHLLTTIRGAGHWIHAEAPDDTTALLKRYLDR